MVVSNREPNARAGFAFALGSILYYVGGMAAGLHLRTVLGLLLSLANDSHPTVHFWAFEALWRTIESSGLSFSSHVPSCLGAIAQFILSDLFDPEDVAAPMSNIALDSPTLASLVRCLDAVINVLGPDLSSSKKSRSLICMLVKEMDHDSEPIVATEAVRCTQHLTLFAPDAVNLQLFIRQLESNLSSNVPEIRQTSCEATYGLVRKDVNRVFEIACASFPDELWRLLNGHGQAAADVEQIILSWAEQTAISHVKMWIEMCLLFLTHSGQRDILLKAELKGEMAANEPAEFMDEAAAFSAQQTSNATTDDTTTVYLRWQAISFALGCLRRVVELNLKQISTSIDSNNATHPLIANVGDLIRVAFSASTSTVVDVRLGGLKLLHDIIKVRNLYNLCLICRGWHHVLILISQRARYWNNTKPK